MIEYTRKDSRRDINKSISSKEIIFSLNGFEFKKNNLFLFQIDNFEILKADFAFIHGKNSSGKSSFIYYLNEYLSNNLSVHKNFFTSMISQELELFESESILSNLSYSYCPKVYKSYHEFKTSLLEYAQMFGIDSILESKVSKNSCSTKMKVSIIRAILSKPNCLLLDEPEIYLDQASTRMLLDILRLINTKNKTAIIWASSKTDTIMQYNFKHFEISNKKLIEKRSYEFH